MISVEEGNEHFRRKLCAALKIPYEYIAGAVEFTIEYRRYLMREQLLSVLRQRVPS